MAVRRANGAAPLVPSCPGWSVSDLVLHLGGVHRGIGGIVAGRLTGPPDVSDGAFLALPADRTGWPEPENAPNRGPVPVSLVDWFADGAARLETLLRQRDSGDAVWTWWPPEQTVGFWSRMQTIEAALHRWDAEGAFGEAAPMRRELAEDAVGHNFEVMVPARRVWQQAPPGSGERFRLRQTDGAGDWTVHFDGAEVRLTEGPGDVELAGTASELMLFVWQRIPADRLEVTGDRAVLDRYFVLAPPG